MSMIPKATLVAIRKSLSVGKTEDVIMQSAIVLRLIDAVEQTSAANEQLADELDRLRRESCTRRCGGMG